MHHIYSYSHGFGRSLYHVVLVPYKRFRMFKRSDIQEQLEMILNSIADRHDFQIHALSVEEDHVHLFIENRPSQSISQIIQYLKGASSRELRKVFPEFYMNFEKIHSIPGMLFQVMKGFHENRLWSGGKFFRPIGEVTPKKVEHYINESQSGHYTDIPDDSFAIQKESNVGSGTPQKTLNDYTR
ncbi:MAG: IS200/IS605 family transposase [Thermoplasmata archaeon]